MSDWQTLLLGTAAYAALAVLAGGVCLLLRMQSGGRAPLLPLPRRPRGAWSGREVILTFLVVVLVPDVCHALLQSIGFYEQFYGRTPARDQQQLWAMLLAMPMIVAVIVTGLHLSSGTRPAQVGLSPVRLDANACVGCLGFLLLSPLVWGIHVAVTQLMEPRGHAFEKILEEAVPVEWALVFFEAIIAAPIYEELVFRGVLQGWLSRAARGGHFAVAMITLVVGQMAMLNFLLDAKEDAPFPGWEPMSFACVLGVGYLLASYRAFRPKAGLPAETPEHPHLAIWGTSALFAVVHGSAWPAPIPLFFLSLGLGWMAQRTHSLIGPILCHALFNGISCLTLLLKALG
ncbi:MAG: CPBP family intramembrane metalloprotease [Planctomycetes bacterium]|nr:CPBP family intramembrane metalloprotease [Planctomycetota bacterium]